MFNIEYLSLMIAILAFAILLTSIVFIYAHIKRGRYDIEKQRAELEMYRRYLEDKIYNITDRLTATEERWRDVNHLLLTSQKNIEYTSEYSKVILTNFLKGAGISDDDLYTDEKLVFLLIPFNSKYNNLYDIIVEECANVGLICVRGDEEFFSQDILNHILKKLVKSRIVVAVIEGRNPNVFYELGIAHAIDKKTILISGSFDELPVDLQSKKILLYKDNIQFRENFRSELTKILVTN